MIWALIPAPIKRGVLWLSAGLAALWGVWLAGRRVGAVSRDLKAAKDNVKAYEVRNEVDSRIATDLDARKRLRDEWSK